MCNVPTIATDQMTSVMAVTAAPSAPFKLDSCVGAKVLQVNLDDGTRTMQNNVEFAHEVSICFRTEENYGKP